MPFGKAGVNRLVILVGRLSEVALIHLQRAEVQQPHGEWVSVWCCQKGCWMAHTGFRQQRGMLCAKLRETRFSLDLGGLCALLTE